MNWLWTNLNLRKRQSLVIWLTKWACGHYGRIIQILYRLVLFYDTRSYRIKYRWVLILTWNKTDFKIHFSLILNLLSGFESRFCSKLRSGLTWNLQAVRLQRFWPSNITICKIKPSRGVSRTKRTKYTGSLPHRICTKIVSNTSIKTALLLLKELILFFASFQDMSFSEMTYSL